MKLLEFRVKDTGETIEGKKMLLLQVMTQGNNNDVACYYFKQSCNSVGSSILGSAAWYCAEHGTKYTKEKAIAAGFIIPDGMHYRR